MLPASLVASTTGGSSSAPVTRRTVRGRRGGAIGNLTTSAPCVAGRWRGSEGPAVAMGMPAHEPVPTGLKAVVPQEVERDAPPADADPIAKIRALKELLDAGAITQEEFDTKKAELLEQV